MSYSTQSNAATTYQDVSTRGSVAEASPHRLIQMLFERALARIAAATGHMERGEIAGKGANISGAMAILDGLQSALNIDEGGEIAANLGALYDYMGRRLFEANVNNDLDKLREVSGLLREIKEAWDAIGSDPAVIQANEREQPSEVTA